MTCREFKHSAVSLTLWELAGARDEQLLAHAETCAPCGAWLQKQRTLAVSMQTLQARTAGREAGPDVERALLLAFRQAAPAGVAVPALSATGQFAVAGTYAALEGGEERIQPLRPVAVPRSTPVALKLSRFFEVGAYVAIAAAIVVSVFLGIRLVQDHRSNAQVLSRSVPASAAAAAHTLKTDAAAQQVVAKAPGAEAVPVPARVVLRKPAAISGARAVEPSAATEAQVAEELPSNDPGYVALMFCDPLSCSSDSQVVRMELPESANASSQPRMADVVVGYDGVVRAVRIVN